LQFFYCLFQFDYSRAPAGLLATVERICSATTGPQAVRAALDQLSWHVLDAALAALPPPVLSRVALLTAPHEDRHIGKLRIAHYVAADTFAG
jgi:hypothetical protein